MSSVAQPARYSQFEVINQKIKLVWRPSQVTTRSTRHKKISTELGMSFALPPQ